MKVDVDIRRLTRNMKALEKQVPFALASTLNNVAFDSMRAIRFQLPLQLKLTKTFIPRQVIVQKANKRNLTAIVGFSTSLPLISKMLKSSRPSTRVAFNGGTIAVPVGVKRSGRGGITKANRPRALLAKPNVFRAVINGTDGIWKRESKAGRRKTGRAISLLYVLKARTKYKASGPVDLERTVDKIVKKSWTTHLKRNLIKAMASARK